MLDHITLEVHNLEKSRDFYKKVLSVLGYSILFEEGGTVGLGADRPMFWIAQSDETYPPSQSVHIAFIAESEAMVRKFYDAALACGGLDNGAPGLRPEYGSNYFAAFVFDLDKNNIEAIKRG